MATSTQRVDPIVAADRLTLEVGDSMSEDGLTRVVLESTGLLYAEQIHRPEPQGPETFDKREQAVGPLRWQMSAQQSLDLLRQAQQFGWGRPFPSRPGIPDEAIVVWRLERAGGEPLVLKAWLRDVEKDPVAGAVLMTLRRQLAEFSNTRLYL